MLSGNKIIKKMYLFRADTAPTLLSLPVGLLELELPVLSSSAAGDN